MYKTSVATIERFNSLQINYMMIFVHAECHMTENEWHMRTPFVPGFDILQ